MFHVGSTGTDVPCGVYWNRCFRWGLLEPVLHVGSAGTGVPYGVYSTGTGVHVWSLLEMMFHVGSTGTGVPCGIYWNRCSMWGLLEPVFHLGSIGTGVTCGVYKNRCSMYAQNKRVVYSLKVNEYKHALKMVMCTSHAKH